MDFRRVAEDRHLRRPHDAFFVFQDDLAAQDDFALDIEVFGGVSSGGLITLLKDDIPLADNALNFIVSGSFIWNKKDPHLIAVDGDPAVIELTSPVEAGLVMLLIEAGINRLDTNCRLDFDRLHITT